MKEDAFEYRDKDLTITYVLKNKSNEVFGFASLAMGAIKSKEKDIGPRQHPGLKIGRMGVDKNCQGKNFGTLLINLSIKIARRLKCSVGCRFLLVDSYPENIGFYEKNGFKTLYSEIGDRDTMPMYLRLEEK